MLTHTVSTGHPPLEELLPGADVDGAAAEDEALNDDDAPTLDAAVEAEDDAPNDVAVDEVAPALLLWVVEDEVSALEDAGVPELDEEEPVSAVVEQPSSSRLPKRTMRMAGLCQRARQKPRKAGPLLLSEGLPGPRTHRPPGSDPAYAWPSWQSPVRC